MIAQFPDPFPDELLYSVLGRYVDRMGFPTHAAACMELFGRRHAVPCVELPNAIEKLVSRLPPGHRYDPEDLIRNHTLLPLFAPFLPERNLLAVRRNMESDQQRLTILISGMAAGGVQPTLFFRSCPACNEDSLRQHGETYWHRIHQVTGVEVCPLHNVFLHSSNARKRSAHVRHRFMSARDAVLYEPRHLDFNDQQRNRLLKLAKGVAWLLQKNELVSLLGEIKEKYRAFLRLKGFLSQTGRLRLDELRTAIYDYWSPKLISLLQCEVPENGEMGWLGRLVRSHRNRAVAPIRHFVLMIFLCDGIESFFQAPLPKSPDLGPFNCMNPTCSRNDKPVIERFVEKNNNYVTFFIFQCPHCGHTSTRPRDGRSINRMLEYGHVWKDRLRVLWSRADVSLLAVSKELNADILTLKRYALKLGLPFPRIGPRRIEQGCVKLPPPNLPTLETLEQKRQQWLELRRKNPGLGRKDLNLKNVALFSWLRRNDRPWLETHLPCKKSKRAKFERVDWDKRDKELAGMFSKVADSWLKMIGKPRRITVTALGREVGCVALLEKKAHMLPRTVAVLASVAESDLQFALRRIAFAKHQLITRGEKATFSDLMRLAGIGSITRQVPGVEPHLRHALAEIHDSISLKAVA